MVIKATRDENIDNTLFLGSSRLNYCTVILVKSLKNLKTAVVVTFEKDCCLLV